ncbi:MAG: undecaprenyl-phosphate glucose phosphotransferase [Myxococcales bacterium]|nr:undecaprenyl-phosphate glucose phosphotransferase [Myxococcales bacterium]
MKKHVEALQLLLWLIDLGLTALAWVGAYWLRFDLGLLPITKGRPPFQFYLASLAAILPIWSLALQAFGLYEPERLRGLGRESVALVEAVAVSVGLLAIFSFFYRDIEFSRLLIVIFVPLDLGALLIARFVARRVVVRRFERGVGVKRVLLVGNTDVAQRFAERIAANPWVGLRVIGWIDDGEEPESADTEAPPRLGALADLSRLVADERVDQVAIALPYERFGAIRQILQTLSSEHLTVRVIPDLFQFDLFMNASIESLDGLPVINLVESPLVGINAVAKRIFDVLFALAFLLIFSPLYLLLAIAVKLSSRGPIFYRQERMGLDGRRFEMLKFRSMPVDAERDGPVWNTNADQRATGLGRLMRRSSLDELPQFVNVLRGEMSVVGPRPERPVFIEQFKERIPRYNLRHKIKAGITGWAQINGWRGDSSLEKRIEYDLHYIENWSLLFDLKIIFLTLFRGFRHRNAN